MGVEKKSVDWAALGLEDFGPTFEKLGINTVNKLIDAAPYLERDHGLTGLCSALGIPNHLKNNSSTTAQTSQSTTSTSTSSSPIWIEVLRSRMVQLFIGALVLIVLYVWIGGELGFVKGELNLTLNNQNPYISLSEVSAVLVSKEDYDTIISPIDENGNINLKARKGEWELYLKYDGLMLHCTSWRSKAAFASSSGATLDITDLFYRALLIKFISPDGETISGKNAYISDNEETWIDCAPLVDGWYVFYFGNTNQLEPLSFKLDGYKPVKLEYDWNKYRVTELEVVLDEVE